MGEASFLSSQFADGEVDVEKGPLPGSLALVQTQEILGSQHLASLVLMMGKQGEKSKTTNLLSVRDHICNVLEGAGTYTCVSVHIYN